MFAFNRQLQRRLSQLTFTCRTCEETALAETWPARSTKASQPTRTVSTANLYYMLIVRMCFHLRACRALRVPADQKRHDVELHRTASPHESTPGWLCHVSQTMLYRHAEWIEGQRAFLACLPVLVPPLVHARVHYAITYAA